MQVVTVAGTHIQVDVENDPLTLICWLPLPGWQHAQMSGLSALKIRSIRLLAWPCSLPSDSFASVGANNTLTHLGIVVSVFSMQLACPAAMVS